MYAKDMSSQTYPTGTLRVRPQDEHQWWMICFAEVRFSSAGVVDCSGEEPWFFPGVSPGEQGTVRRLKKDEDHTQLSQKYGVSADRRTRIVGLRVDPSLWDKSVGFAVLDTSTVALCPTRGRM